MSSQLDLNTAKGQSFWLQFDGLTVDGLTDGETTLELNSYDGMYK